MYTIYIVHCTISAAQKINDTVINWGQSYDLPELLYSHLDLL